MQKTTTTLIALILMLALTPTTSADPATRYPYTSAAGYYLGDLPAHPYSGCHDVAGDEEEDACLPSGRGFGIMFFPNTRDGCHWGCLPLHPVGAIHYYSSDWRFYDNGVFIPDDEVWADKAALTACMLDSSGDRICDDDPNDGDIDVTSDWACGQATLLGDPTDAVTYDEATVFVLSVAIYDDFGKVCGGTNGSILGDMY